MNEAITEALRDGHGVLVLAKHKLLKQAVRQARERGELTPVLRGIYALPDVANTFEVRCLALWAKDPDAVLVGPSAARVHDIDVKVDDTVYASSHRLRQPRPGFDLVRRSIEVDHVHEAEGVRATTRELTLLDLARTHGVGVLSDGLRAGTPLDLLTATLERTRKRRGNGALRLLLDEIRDQPWSAAEAVGHTSLRKHRIKGWEANFEVATPAGPKATAKIDIALPDLLLGFEIDGYGTHGTKEAFHHDRGRDTELAQQSWYIYRVSATWVMDHPDEFAEFVANMIAQRKLLLGHHPTKQRRGRARLRKVLPIG